MVGAPASAVRGSLMAGLWLHRDAGRARGDGVSRWPGGMMVDFAVRPAQLFASHPFLCDHPWA